jgi:hypothetical protein
LFLFAATPLRAPAAVLANVTLMVNNLKNAAFPLVLREALREDTVSTRAAIEQDGP